MLQWPLFRRYDYLGKNFYLYNENEESMKIQGIMMLLILKSFGKQKGMMLVVSIAINCDSDEIDWDVGFGWIFSTTKGQNPSLFWKRGPNTQRLASHKMSAKKHTCECLKEERIIQNLGNSSLSRR